MSGSRHKARIAAMQALYEGDCSGHDPRVVLERLIGPRDACAAPISYAWELLEGVLGHREELDGTISRFAAAWPLEQMAPVDRNILRLAIFEIVTDRRVPAKAAINEAVELAKAFGSEASASFINGVLGSVSALAVE